MLTSLEQSTAGVFSETTRNLLLQTKQLVILCSTNTDFKKFCCSMCCIANVDNGLTIILCMLKTVEVMRERQLLPIYMLS